MKHSFDQSVIVAVLIALLMGVGYLSLIGIGNLVEAAHGVEHTQIVIDRLQTLFTDDEEESMAMRSFLITGNSTYRQSFQKARQAVEAQLQELKELTSDNPARQSDLAQLQELLNQHMALMERLDQSDKNVQPPLVVQQVEESNKLIDQIKARITAMQADERLLLQQRAAGTQRSSTVLQWIIIAGAVLGLIVLLINALSLRGEMAARKRTQRELDRFFTLTSDMFCIAGFDGYFKTLNPAWEKTFGYKRKELLSKPFEEFLHPDDLEKTRQVFASQQHGQEVVNFENRYRCKDGSYRWLLWSAQSLVDEQSIFATARDVTERKQSEETLRQNEEQFRTMISAIPQLAWMAQADGFIFWYNQRWFDYTGTTPQQMEGWGWQSVHDPDWLPKVLERWKEAIASGQPFEMEFPLRAADGHYGWFLTRVLPLKDAAGRVVRWFGTNTDVSHKREVEQTLLKSQQLFEGLFENSPDAIILVNQAGRIVSVNTRIDALFGYTRAELEGQGVETLMPERYRASHGGHLAGYFAAPRTRPMGAGLELFARRKDGSEFPVDIMLSPLQTDEGSRALAVIRDITVRKRIEEELLSSQQRLRMALEGAQLGDWELDLQTQASRRSLRHDQIFGYAELLPEWTYPMFLKHVHPEDRARVDQAFQESVAGGRDWYFECRIIRADQAVRWIWARGRVFKDKSGRSTHMIGMVGDITERRESEERIKKLNKALGQRADLLEVANKELEAFSYSVSHDLRAPLRHIHGFVEMLQKSPVFQEDEKSRRQMGVISSAAKEMGRLIDDLLAFSRTGRAEMHPVEINMREMIDQVIQDLEVACQERKVTWEIKPLSEALGDPNLLRLVWTNLLDNALKYTRTRQEAKIEIGQVGRDDPNFAAGEVGFYVRDNGVGFDMQYVSKLFGVFQRLHRAEDFEGTGIGLANVQRIIHRHGGRVWAEGQIDSGATFYFSLPVTSIQPV